MVLPEQPSYDERSLLHAVAEGDQKAFTRLVDLYWNRVYSHALAYTKSAPRAQEITQDIFVKIWKKRDTLREINDFAAFLFILGKHQLISAMRKKLETTTELDPLELFEGSLPPDQQLEYKQAYDTILNAIDQLPPKRKTVFKLSRFEGLSHEEIATTMGISRNTVKEHIVQSLNFIRNYLHSRGGLLALLLLARLVGL